VTTFRIVTTIRVGRVEKPYPCVKRGVQHRNRACLVTVRVGGQPHAPDAYGWSVKHSSGNVDRFARRTLEWPRFGEKVSSTGLPPDGDPAVAAFLKAVGTGRVEAVRAMLAASPQLVNAVGPHPFWGGRGQALHVAIETKRREIVDVLLEHGADVNGDNDEYDHWSPLMVAIDQPAIRDELLRRGARVRLVEALMLADDRRVDELLSSDGLPPTVPNGGSLLAFARTPLAIDRLIALGASTDRPDRWGATPMDAMSRLGPRGAPLVART
jgi:hypothetical protein